MPLFQLSQCPPRVEIGAFTLWPDAAMMAPGFSAPRWIGTARFIQTRDYVVISKSDVSEPRPDV